MREMELHKNIMIILSGDSSRRGLSAICAWSVRVSASSNTMTFGSVFVGKNAWNDERTKGYTRLLTASRPLSSLEFRKRALPKIVFVLFFACRASTKYLTDVVFPEPGGPIIIICERADGFFNIVVRRLWILCGRPRFSISFII